MAMKLTTGQLEAFLKSGGQAAASSAAAPAAADASATLGRVSAGLAEGDGVLGKVSEILGHVDSIMQRAESMFGGRKSSKEEAAPAPARGFDDYGRRVLPEIVVPAPAAPPVALPLPAAPPAPASSSAPASAPPAPAAPAPAPEAAPAAPAPELARVRAENAYTFFLVALQEVAKARPDMPLADVVSSMQQGREKIVGGLSGVLS